jgi:hypothetical protein
MPSPPNHLAALAGFEPLRRAERLIVRAVASGLIAKVALRLPEAATAETSVRGSFLAALLRDGLPLSGRRLEVVGAFVEGRVDLGDAQIGGSLWFYRCRFDSPLLLDAARVAGAVTLAGCRLAALMAEGCTVAGDLAVHAGTRADDELRLSRARIGGDLDATRLDLTGRDDTEPQPLRRALVADAIRVGGDVRLADGFRAIGEVRLRAARIDGDLRISGNFTGSPERDGGRGTALMLDRIQVGGSLRMDGGFFGAAGLVSLRQARIAGDLDASGASFDRLGDASLDDEAVLALDRTQIDGSLILCGLQTPLRGASFVRARVGTLVDDETSWGTELVLDGFSYGRLGDDSPLDTVFRLDWLERQRPSHLEDRFRMQPWRRLIRVLRRMGHDSHATSIALQREMRLRAIGWVGAWAPPALRWLPRAGHWLLGALAGYGYRPGRLLGWLAAVWLLCAGVYWLAQERAPRSLAAVEEAGFNALGFSLDRLLPWLNSASSARGPWATGWSGVVQWLSYAQGVFGLLVLALLLASLAGWMDRDRQR